MLHGVRSVLNPVSNAVNVRKKLAGNVNAGK